MVAGDGDSVGAALTLDEADGGAAGRAAATLLDGDFFSHFSAALMMVVSAAERVYQPFGSTLHAAAEAVVLTLVVVVSHFLFFCGGCLVDNDFGGAVDDAVLVDFNGLSAGTCAGVLYVESRVLLEFHATTCWTGTLKLDVVVCAVVLLVGRVEALTVGALGDVELCIAGVIFTIVDDVSAVVVLVATTRVTLDVDLNVGASLGELLVAVAALTSDLYSRSETVTFLVDADVFLAARTVFLGDGLLEGSESIFPSDALLGDLCLDLGVLLDALLRTLVLVGRWEDAKGDGNLGVKVQVAD